MECGGGPQIHAIRKVYVCDTSKRVTTGWRDQIIDSADVTGREGLRDSVVVQKGGTYYAVVVNNVGPSCMSNPVTIADSAVTGVGDSPGRGDPLIQRRFFDIRGRLVRGPLVGAAAGVYFEKRWYRSGRTTTRKVVVLK